jgi:hypothetical protein
MIHLQALVRACAVDAEPVFAVRLGLGCDHFQRDLNDPLFTGLKGIVEPIPDALLLCPTLLPQLLLLGSLPAVVACVSCGTLVPFGSKTR